MGGSRSHSECFLCVPVLIFWSSIPCVIHYTLLKVVSYYEFSVLSMSAMGFQTKKVWMGGGWAGGPLSSFILDFLNFEKPLSPH